MEPKVLIQALGVAEKLKNVTRHCYTTEGRHESVAEHSWRTALMAMLLSEQIPEVDMGMVIRMCLIHDLGEAFTGDIPSFEKTKAHEQAEEDRLNAWVDSLPAQQRKEFSALYKEMNERTTLEAKVYKAIDRLEAVIQHNESHISTWLPLEYELQLTYGEEDVKVHPMLQAIKDENNRRTKEKIAQSKEQ